MKILHILGNFKIPRHPDEEGTSGVVRAVLEIARAQVALGHEVWIATVDNDAWQSEWQGIKLVSFKPLRWARGRLGTYRFDFSVHLPYVLLTRKIRFDVVQGHIYVYLRFLRAGAQIAHFHSDPFYEGSGTTNIAVHDADFLRIAQHSQAQVAVSCFVAKQLRRGLQNAGNIHVVYNGVNFDHFDPHRHLETRQALRQEWGVKDDGVVFLYAGAVVPEKGVLHLARAFTRLCEQGANVHLAIAGNSTLWGTSSSTMNHHREYETNVQALLDIPRKLGLVHLLGAVRAVDMPGLYAASDAVVVPSIWQEAFGLVAVEALASARPVVASAIGGLPEIVNESTGILVPPGDEEQLAIAMTRLSVDAEMRQRLGTAARTRARSFTWQKAAHELNAIYAACIDKAVWY